MIRRAGAPSVHALGLAAAGASLLAASFLPLGLLGLFACPFHAATGVPCPTCGCTRAFHAFVHGDLTAAFLTSPLGTLLALVCALHLGWTLLRLAGLPWAPSIEPTRRVRWGTAALIAGNWAFLVVRGAV